MYNAHFGLERSPFKITPDTTLFYKGGQRGRVLEALVYAILGGEGIIKVVGEVGTGKTMLCRMLHAELPVNVEVVYLANPSLAPEEIHQAIALEMGLTLAPGATRLEVLHTLQQHMLDKYARNEHVVVLVEEAQSMPKGSLEEIRLLSNLETRQDKLLQVVLFGQPELDTLLADPSIRQLRERITHSFHLEPLSPQEVREYVNFRLRSAGFKGRDVFDEKAYEVLAKASKGLSRRINILADKSLLAAFAEDTHDVRKRHVKIAVDDSEMSRKVGPARGPGRSWGWPESLLSAGALLVLVAIALTFWRGDGAGWSGSQTSARGTDAAADAGLTAVPTASAQAPEAAATQVEPVAEVGSGATHDSSPPSSAPPAGDGAVRSASGRIDASVGVQRSGDAEIPRADPAPDEQAPGEQAPGDGSPGIAGGPAGGMLPAAPSGSESRSRRSLDTDVPVTTPDSGGPVAEAQAEPGGGLEATLADRGVAVAAPPPESPVVPSEMMTRQSEPAVQAAPQASSVAVPEEPRSSTDVMAQRPAAAATPVDSTADAAGRPPEETLVDARVSRTRAWLQEKHRTRYSIQIMVSDAAQREALEKFLRRRQDAGDLDDVYCYPSTLNGRPAFVVFYKAFVTFEAATAELVGLPAALKRYQPYVRNMTQFAARERLKQQAGLDPAIGGNRGSQIGQPG
ncbi:MAG: AAA family ATPase [Gammaproteobacteria bacterium]